MLTQFFARHNPDSTNAKPRFIKKTRKAVTSVHMVSMPTFTLSISGAAPSWPIRTAGMPRSNRVKRIGARLLDKFFVLLKVSVAVQNPHDALARVSRTYAEMQIPSPRPPSYLAAGSRSEEH